MIPFSTELSAKPSSKAMCPKEALITLHDLKNCRSSESKGWRMVYSSNCDGQRGQGAELKIHKSLIGHCCEIVSLHLTILVVKSARTKVIPRVLTQGGNRTAKPLSIWCLRTAARNPQKRTTISSWPPILLLTVCRKNKTATKRNSTH